MLSTQQRRWQSWGMGLRLNLGCGLRLISLQPRQRKSFPVTTRCSQLHTQRLLNADALFVRFLAETRIATIDFSCCVQITQHHIVPEFSFLDQRGYGCYEGSPVAEARAAVWREDGRSPDYRMPPNEDGTPNESLRDVQVRVRQALQVRRCSRSPCSTRLSAFRHAPVSSMIDDWCLSMRPCLNPAAVEF